MAGGVRRIWNYHLTWYTGGKRWDVCHWIGQSKGRSSKYCLSAYECALQQWRAIAMWTKTQSSRRKQPWVKKIVCSQDGSR